MSKGEGENVRNAGRTAEPLVSVVVPVYNVVRTLDRCMRSIVRQTYRHLEIILVDDGSTDGSSRLCDVWGARDVRITVIHQRNQGLSAARNAGVDHAHGAFLCFVDSDDWLAPEYAGAMVDAAIRYHADLVICGYSNVSMGGRTSQSLPYGGVCGGREYLKHADIINSVYTVAWNRLYRIDLCKTVRFPDNLLYEDRYTFFRFFHAANIVVGLERSLYCYDNNPDGITHAIHDVRKLDLAQVYLVEMRFYLDHGYVSILREYANTLTVLFLKLMRTVYLQRKEESGEAYPATGESALCRTERFAAGHPPVLVAVRGGVLFDGMPSCRGLCGIGCVSLSVAQPCGSIVQVVASGQGMGGAAYRAMAEGYGSLTYLPWNALVSSGLRLIVTSRTCIIRRLD
ncbi:glycosyltransferase family 2 protein [Bifidobacterium cebidarum]|uniref:Glycosyl transferase family 2 n=1 Tax=Bifidobacterium cebidarum TaxID=2650773 RepID=A0A6I1G922_9BIFI|nr:glycosyltransferase family 2 protein [Bifidobacterium cebidarum]KAB7788204.1 glycosyl transferase family 2 [Bifidobacterium cebidarum]